MTELGHQPVWVFGAGGLGGIAWETGILTGLADEGVTIAPDATIIGTSAGSTVAAQVTSGEPLSELYAGQLAGVPYEISKDLRPRQVLELIRLALFVWTPEEFGRRVGEAAIAAKTGPVQERRAVIEARLPRHEWPDSDLRIVTVNAVSGTSRVIVRDDGVDLVDAVAASCAVPLVWPVVNIGGRQYIDGGMRSPLNLDLAPGTGPVVALAPITRGIGRWSRLTRQRRALAAERAVTVITMSEEAKKAQGRNSLDRSIVAAVATAGREQGRRIAAEVAATLRR